MLIGIPKEIKNHEYRVGMAPASVRELIDHGHKVIVETGAAAGIGLGDDKYLAVGAEIVSLAEEVFARADMIIKVKEPQANECKLLREGQILFTYLHLAAEPHLAELLQASGCIAVAYETVTDQFGRLPLLVPMSEVAGRMAIQAGAHHLEKAQGGSGVLLSGVPGVSPAKVVVLGGGVVGTSSIFMAVGMGAQVAVLDKSLPRLRELSQHFGASLKTIYATRGSIEKYVWDADLVVGAVLGVPGSATPKLVTKDMLGHMRPGSVIVDVSIDQGGCFETSRPTTHQNPTYVIDGVIHYCVTNMPAAVARTSTFALNNATLPYALEIANKGYKNTLLANPHLLNGLNLLDGKFTNAAVAKALSKECVPAEEVLASA